MAFRGSIFFFFSPMQEYSVQITFRQKWNDDRLSYDHRLSLGDMRSKFSKGFGAFDLDNDLKGQLKLQLCVLWVCTNMYANFRLCPFSSSGAISGQHFFNLDLYREIFIFLLYFSFFGLCDKQILFSGWSKCILLPCSRQSCGRLCQSSMK